MERIVSHDSVSPRSVSHDVGHETVHEAQAATDAEKSMGFLAALRLYPKAAAWSVLCSTAIIMEGFDVALIASLYGFPAFAERYGERQADGSYVISAPWQAALSNGSVCGEIIGLAICGLAAERFGYRKTLIGALSILTAFIFIPFFAKNVQTLLAGEILMGIPWGIFQTLLPAYAAEVCPVALRAYLCSYINVCWVIGQLIASSVLRGMLSNNTQWSYRIPFALQWIWPVPIIVGSLLAPESPWWLVRKGRIDEARVTLQRLTSRKHREDGYDVDKTVSMMRHTDSLERSVAAGTSYLDCFRGINLRRTEIACTTWAIQNLCGSAFMGFSILFYERAGLAAEHAFDLSMAQYGIGAIGTILSWFLIRRFGRRSIYIGGELLMLAFLLVIGIIGVAANGSQGASWAVGSMLLGFTFVYDLSVGSVCYAIVAEIPSTRLRAKTVVLARIVFNVFQIINWVITPYQLGQDAWNWGAKTGLFWAGILSLCIIWTYFRLPEAKGRTYGELDVLFEQGVPARLFSKTSVDHVPTSGSTAGKDSVSDGHPAVATL